MKKFILLFTLLSFLFQFSNAQNKKGVSTTIKTISGYDLVDYPESYDGKNIGIYVIYEARKNFDRKLRSAVYSNETEGEFSPTQLRKLENIIGSNNDYYSREVALYEALDFIKIRIPFSILNQIPNVDALGYLYVTGKWNSQNKVLIVTGITRAVFN
jgi:hypothetical protein